MKAPIFSGLAFRYWARSFTVAEFCSAVRSVSDCSRFVSMVPRESEVVESEVSEEVSVSPSCPKMARASASDGVSPRRAPSRVPQASTRESRLLVMSGSTLSWKVAAVVRIVSEADCAAVSRALASASRESAVEARSSEAVRRASVVVVSRLLAARASERAWAMAGSAPAAPAWAVRSLMSTLLSASSLSAVARAVLVAALAAATSPLTVPRARWVCVAPLDNCSAPSVAFLESAVPYSFTVLRAFASSSFDCPMASSRCGTSS